jgi:hypothetical protein
MPRRQTELPDTLHRTAEALLKITTPVMHRKLVNKHSRLKWPILATVVAIALVVRLIGLNHGAPKWVFHPDVGKQAKVAKYNYRGITNPRTLYHQDDEETLQHALYPYGASVIAGRSARVIATVVFREPNRFWNRQPFFWAYTLRQVAVYGFSITLGVLLLGLYRHLGPLPTFVTGLFLALSPFHVEYAHYGMNDIPLLCSLLLAWLTTSHIRSQNEFRAADKAQASSNTLTTIWAVAALPLASFGTGLILGIGFGIKYQAVIGLIFPATVWLSYLLQRNWRNLLLSGGLCIAGFVVGTAFTCPLLWQQPDFFFKWFLPFMRWQSQIFNHYNITGETFDTTLTTQIFRNTAWAARYACKSGIIIFLPGLVWAIQRCIRHVRTKADPVETHLLGTALIFFVLMNAILIAGRQLMRETDILITTPFLLIANGFFLRDLLTRWPVSTWRGRSILATALTVATLFLWTDIRNDAAFLRPDTRILAREWCQETLEPRFICRDRYTIPTKIEGMKEEHVKFLCDPTCAPRVMRNDFDYLMTSSLSWRRMGDRFTIYHNQEKLGFYTDLTNRYEKLIEITDRELLHRNPTIAIYGAKELNE